MTEDIKNLQSVVDTVNNVIRRRLLSNKFALVLLVNFSLSGGEITQLVNICRTGVRSVGDDLSSNSWVHTGHLEVSTDISVVDINDGGSSEVSNVLVIDNSVGSGCGSCDDCCGDSCLGEELAASGGFSAEGGGGLGACLGSKSSSGAE